MILHLFAKGLRFPKKLCVLSQKSVAFAHTHFIIEEVCASYCLYQNLTFCLSLLFRTFPLTEE